jgi:hypothetical protein
MARSVSSEVKHSRHASNVQVAFMLSGEAGGGQILGRRRTSHGHRDVFAILGFQLAISRTIASRSALVPVTAYTIRRASRARPASMATSVTSRPLQRMQAWPGIGGLKRVAIRLGSQRKAC